MDILVWCSAVFRILVVVGYVELFGVVITVFEDFVVRDCRLYLLDFCDLVAWFVFDGGLRGCFAVGFGCFLFVCTLVYAGCLGWLVLTWERGWVCSCGVCVTDLLVLTLGTLCLPFPEGWYNIVF